MCFHKCLFLMVGWLSLIGLREAAYGGPPQKTEAAKSFFAENWRSGWSGQNARSEDAADLRTPDGQTPVRFWWEKGNGATLPTFSASFPPERLSGDVLTFWLRVDRPLEKLQIVLNDADDVGAETSVPSLLGLSRLEPGRWYYVVWPFRVSPGWVRYARPWVDWDRIRGLSFYTWPDQIPSKIRLEFGPFRPLTFSELESVFCQFPERVSNNRAVPWRVLTEKQDGMMSEYFRRRFQNAVKTLRESWPAERVVREQEQLRRALAATYLMPEEHAKVSDTLMGTVDLDGVRVEKHLLRLRPGVASPALLFLPRPGKDAAGDGRQPTIFMLPGHGDPFWSPSMQARCLSFAKRGWVVMVVQPFGQGERGENPRWSESHDSQAMAFLLATGQSLMGLIMADHQAELSWLLERPQVDAQRVAVTGVSMGGTHSLWFAAMEPRVRAAVAVAVAPLARANWGAGHHGLCDLMVGMFRVADDDLIRALVAPRPFLELCPSVQAPLSEEGQRLCHEGRIADEDARKRYPITPQGMVALHPVARQTYALLEAADWYGYEVVAGPHDYTKAGRERAAGFLSWCWQGGEGPASLAEPKLTPIQDRGTACDVLTFWPHVDRPADILSPTAYVQREIRALIQRLPPPPKTLTTWQTQRENLRRRILALLGTSLAARESTWRAAGTFRAERGEGRKLVAKPEEGIELPMHLFAPADGVRPDGRLVVLLHPGGMQATSSSVTGQRLTAEGAWVLCPDLRGTGETRFNEQGGYMGVRDLDMGVAALKLGETLAGCWVRDCLAAVAAAKQVAGGDLKTTICGEGEMGMIALLAAAQEDDIAAVELKGFLASYYSAAGYGFPFAYSDEKNDKSVRNRRLSGFGSMLPCIPHILKYADIPQIMALVAPRPLTVIEPKWASGDSVAARDYATAFQWTADVYTLLGCRPSLRVLAGDARPVCWSTEFWRRQGTGFLAIESTFKRGGSNEVWARRKSTVNDLPSSAVAEMLWRTRRALQEPNRRKQSTLGGAPQRHEGKVPLFTLEGHIHLQTNAGFALHQRDGAGTEGTARPLRAWFEPRLPVGCTLLMVDFPWRPAVQGHVRAVGVVPRGKIVHLAMEGFSSQRHQHQPGDVLLEGQDQSLDHGDAAVLADGAKPRLDPLIATPILETLTPELRSFVDDQVLGFGIGRMDHPALWWSTEF